MILSWMEWKIKARSEVCSQTGHLFGEGEAFYTLLVEEEGRLVRKDLSLQAWQERDPRLKAVSFWRSIFKPALSEKPDPLQKQDAESEFRRLLEQEDEASRKLCYLLALFLERKRYLRLRQRECLEGKRVSIYEHTQTQETFLIPEVDFKLSELDQLQTQLTGASPFFAPLG